MRSLVMILRRRKGDHTGQFG